MYAECLLVAILILVVWHVATSHAAKFTDHSQRWFGTTGVYEKPRIEYIYAEWCPYCKRFRPVWESLIANLHQYAKFVELDGERVETGAKHYPTLRAYVRGDMYEYKGPLDYESVRFWILQRYGKN